MTFRHPWMFLLLLAVPLLALLRYGSWRRPVLRFSDGALLSRLPLTWAVAAAKLLPLMYLAALALLVVAMARPQFGLEESREHTETVDIVLLLDLSTSMRAEDFSSRTQRRNRLDAAKEVMEQFVSSRDDDRIGVVAFAGLPYTVSPLTLDHDWLLHRMSQLRTGMLEDGTAIGSAIGSAVNRLRDSEAKSKLIVLLTDGVNNAGNLTPENAAQAAEALGIKVYTVGAGSRRSSMSRQGLFGLTQYAEIDEETLQQIADITGGMYFRATDFDSLQNVYREIDQMERTEIEVERFKRYKEAFAPFLIVGLGLLLLEKLLALTRLRRLP